MKIYKSYLVYLAIAFLLIITFIFFKGGDIDKDHPGPHGGKMLVEGDMAVELTIYERGMPPHFRVYLYRNEKPLSPTSANLVETL
jgi:hypothetical protein